jgi:putative two-component system response regulator
MKPQPTVLIIDDEPVIRDTLEALLCVDFDVQFAENGASGIAAAQQIQPDVILLDVMMPVIDGFEVCRQIRALPLLAEVPILMVTALDDRESRIRGLRMGADDFITKPFDGLELQARLQTITRLNRYRRLMEQRIELEKSHQELLISYQKTIEGWVMALDLRDKETEGHTLRVTRMTLELARAAGLPEEGMEDIRRGALLHDIGKLAIPDSILLKPGRLTEEEWVIMRKHPVYAYEWLSPIQFLARALDIPYRHHEKWDGSGYPNGLSGADIPIAARLFAIVDVWDALCSERPYHAPMPEPDVLHYLQEQAGKHFEPRLVELFLALRIHDKN